MKNYTILNDMLKSGGMWIHFKESNVHVASEKHGHSSIGKAVKMSVMEGRKEILMASKFSDMLKIASGEKDAKWRKLYKNENCQKVWAVLDEWAKDCYTKIAEDLLPNRYLALLEADIDPVNLKMGQIRVNNGGLKFLLKGTNNPNPALLKLKEWSEKGILDLNAFDVWGN
jgi:hypothetical protein